MSVFRRRIRHGAAQADAPTDQRVASGSRPARTSIDGRDDLIGHIADQHISHAHP
jgi:hypothetical protein